MTVQIPLRFLVGAVGLIGMLGIVFGISYAVFEWRDSAGVSDESLERLDSEIDDLRSRINSLNAGSGGVSAVQARTIAQEEASKASDEAIRVVVCMEGFRGSGLSEAQLEAGIRGCLEQ